MFMPMLAGSLFCQPRTNLQVIGDLLQEVAEEACRALPGNDSAAVQIVPLSTECKWNWLVEKSLLQTLRSVSRSRPAAVVSAPALSGGRLAIRYAPEEMKISYERKGRFWSRRVRLSLFVQISVANGDVLEGRSLQRESTDAIRPGDVSAVENADWPFTRGEGPPRRTLARILEPALIAAITGGVIYLFYSFRTPS